MDKDIIKVDQKKLIEVVTDGVKNGGAVRITVVGSSMYPFLRSGVDSVELYAADEIKRNDVLFYLRGDGDCILHRCIAIKGDEYIMCGDNQFQKEYGIRRENIIAVARAFYRGSARITDDTGWYRAYKLLWCTMFTARPFMCAALKCVMKVKRRIKRK